MSLVTNKEYETDVAIIGAGPVGLFAIFQCGMVGLKCHVIDSLPDIGGQCTALYPEKPIYDIPAYPKILAGNLIDELTEQAAPFNPTYHLEQQVCSVERQSSIYALKTSADITIKSKVVIVAGGPGSFGPNKPPLENLEEYEQSSVFYYVRAMDEFKGKDILIAGGGDSAVDWAVNLASVARTVSIVHRRDKFRALPESLTQLQSLAYNGKINILTPYQLDHLIGQDGILQKVAVRSKNNQITEIKADILLPFYGLSNDLGPICDWGLTLNHNMIETHPTTAQTNIEGIYAVGDIATYENKQKFILTGFSEAAFAAQHIYSFLNPDKPMHFEYSTTKGIPN